MPQTINDIRPLSRFPAYYGGLSDSQVPRFAVLQKLTLGRTVSRAKTWTPHRFPPSSLLMDSLLRTPEWNARSQGHPEAYSVLRTPNICCRLKPHACAWSGSVLIRVRSSHNAFAYVQIRDLRSTFGARVYRLTHESTPTLEATTVYRRITCLAI